MLFCWGTNLNPPHSSTQNAIRFASLTFVLLLLFLLLQAEKSPQTAPRYYQLLCWICTNISHQTISSPSALPQNRTDRFPANSRKSTPKHRNRIKSTFRTSHITSLGPVDWWFLAKKFNPTKEEIDEVENFFIDYDSTFHGNL